MRSEQEIRSRLQGEVLLYEGFGTADSTAARACHERQMVLIWVLSDPTDPTPTTPPEGGNGAP